MLVLMLSSGFFSCSEAALFYLGREDCQLMLKSGPGARAAVRLLDHPQRLLTSILFWNLVINMAYFALASMIALGLQKEGFSRQASLIAFGALLLIIVFSEMLPKNLGVIWPRRLAGLLGLPLAAATRLLDPVIPTLQAASGISQRLVAPRFEPEPYMELGDLERAIEISGNDPQLVEQEQNILSRIVALSECTAEEVMRPRREYLAFTPPATVKDLGGEQTPSGYVLITETDNEEIAAAISLDKVALLPPGEPIDRYAEPVILVPWSATAAATLTQLREENRQVAAVLNELGETVGVITLEGLLAEVLQPEPARNHPRDRPGTLQQLGDNVWQATGRTTLRRVAKRLATQLPATKTMTVAGLLQEQLQRLPDLGDEVSWGNLVWRVKADSEENGLVVEIERCKAQSNEDGNPS